MNRRLHQDDENQQLQFGMGPHQRPLRGMAVQILVIFLQYQIRRGGGPSMAVTPIAPGENVGFSLHRRNWKGFDFQRRPFSGNSDAFADSLPTQSSICQRMHESGRTGMIFLLVGKPLF